MSRQFTVEDFVTPHAGFVVNAHIYHTEVSGFGHVPPERIEEIEDRLDLLRRIGCNWWVLEVRETEGLLQMKEMIDSYLAGTVTGEAQKRLSVDD